MCISGSVELKVGMLFYAVSAFTDMLYVPMALFDMSVSQETNSHVQVIVAVGSYRQ
jgi:hypothetical protein